jgi:hypothetical protein
MTCNNRWFFLGVEIFKPTLKCLNGGGMVLKRINGPGHTSIAPVVRLFHQDAPTLIEFSLFCGENVTLFHRSLNVPQNHYTKSLASDPRIFLLQIFIVSLTSTKAYK